MNATLVTVGTICGSFCNPSRGPTSTIFTCLGVLMSFLRSFKIDQHGPFVDGIALGITHGSDTAGGRR